MKRKYFICLAVIVILDLLIVCSDVSLIPDVVHGGMCTLQISKGIWCALFDILLFIFTINARLIFDMPYEILKNRQLVWNLSKNDFKVRYVGSYLGIFWAFINPLVTIMLYWIVFQFAFHSQPVDGHPFVLWLIAGLVPWFLIQDAITNATMALMEYAYLVKKVLFQVGILPAIKVISSCFVHVVFMLVVLIIYMLLGYYPDVYYLQLVYYFGCAVVFILALSYATSAIQLFVRDLSQFIGVFMQVFMWSTPIMWNIQIIPERFQWVFKMNPAYYIIIGYRDSLLYHTNVTSRMGVTLYFWCVIVLLLIVGSRIFKRLRPHFADVL